MRRFSALLVVCLMVPAFAAERVYLLEQRGPAASFQPLGELHGARRVAVPAAGGHLLVATARGLVYSWGQNLYGQLGTGDTAAHAGFVAVPGVFDVTGIAAGAQHSVVLKSDGTVWTWGANSEGQLGDGTLLNRAVPAMVPELRDVSMVGAGALFTIALKADGTVWVFGSNWSGIAGSDSRKMVTEPVRVAGLGEIRSIAVQAGTGYALDSAGRVWAWGPEPARVLDAPAWKATLEAKVAGLGGLEVGPSTQIGGGVLRTAAGRTFGYEGTAVDAAAGWAVAVITSDEQAVELSAARPARLEPWAGAGTAGAMEFARGAGTAAAAGGYPQLAAGTINTLLIRPDGSLRVWGGNLTGTLGDGTLTSRFAPGCALISGVKAVASSGFQAFAIKTDSTVWGWGLSSYGSLGDDIYTTHMRLTPAAVPGLSGVTAVQTGYAHAVALKNDGTVWAWGDNGFGQIGMNPIYRSMAHPVQVVGLSGIVAIAAGGNRSMALAADGTVYTWGENTIGGLGDGTTISHYTPAPIPSLKASAIWAGTDHDVVIATNGTVWGWGGNSSLQLGSTFAIMELRPVQLAPFTDAVQLAGLESTVFLRADGSVWWIGDYIGNGAPTNLGAPAGVVAVSAGVYHVALLMPDGRVFSRGSNADWQLGVEDTNPSSVFVPTVADASCTGVAPIPLGVGQKIAAGLEHTAIVRADGTVWTAGNNTAGQIGDGTAIQRTSAVQVPGVSGITGLSADFRHNLAVDALGRVQAWGLNTNGSIGNLTTANQLSAVYANGLVTASRVAAGATHSLAAKTDGTVWAWGDNAYGQLTGNAQWQTSPWQVSSVGGAIDVAAGNGFSLMLRGDGTVWAWGRNDKGQLASGTLTNRSNPAQVSGLSNIVAIAAGDSFGMALQRDGQVWTWGDSTSGQLGTGTVLGQVLGVAKVSGLTGVVAISAGGSHALAVKSDGTVWAWGNNGQGQLGVAGVGTKTLPVQVPMMFGIASVSAGGSHSLAWARDGSLWAWGSNQYGQFGLAQPNNTSTPMLSGFQPGLPVNDTPLGAAAVSGTSSSQNFDFQFHAGAGYQSLQWVQMFFGAETDGGGQSFCFLHYDVAGNGLWLYGEGGFFLGPVAPGSTSNQLQNSYCALNPAATSISGSGVNLTVHAQVLFKQVGTRKVFLRSMSWSLVDSGWIQMGNWDSTAAPLAVMSVTPAAGSGATGAIAAQWVEPTGLPVTSGGWVQMLVANSSQGDGTPFCFLHYDRGGNGLWVYSGDVGFFLGPVTPGVASNALDSPACALNPAATTVQQNGGTLVIHPAFTFKAPMAGQKKIFQRSLDALWRDTGWVQTGTWLVP